MRARIYYFETMDSFQQMTATRERPGRALRHLSHDSSCVLCGRAADEELCSAGEPICSRCLDIDSISF